MRISHDSVCERALIFEKVSNASFFVRSNQESIDEYGNIINQSVFEECLPNRLDHLKVLDFSPAMWLQAGVNLESPGLFVSSPFNVVKKFEK